MIKNTRKITRGRTVNASSFIPKDPSGKPMKTNAQYMEAVDKINARFEKMKIEFNQLSLDELYYIYSEQSLSSTDKRALHDAYKAKIDAEYRETLEKGLNVVPNNKLSELYINELKHSIENKEIYK
jgi:hypothetical protein